MMSRNSRKGVKSDRRSYTRLYTIYCNMKSRCYYEKNPRYKTYGGKGVIICDEWRKDYINFKEWANANGYSDELTIDRIDVGGNYEPNNCRWISNKEQQNNKTTNVYYTYMNETKTLQQWSEKININYKTLQKRFRKWGIEKAINTPIDTRFQRGLKK